MKHSFASALALATALTALGSLTGLAAQAPEKPEAIAAAPLSAVYKIGTEKGADGTESISISLHGDGVPANLKNAELKTDEEGNRYFLTESGEKVYISVCESPDQTKPLEKIELTPSK